MIDIENFFMRKTLPFLNFEPQDSGPQYLEDLATGYWFSEVLFAALEIDLFSLLEGDGAAVGDLASRLEMNPDGLERFLKALAALGLVTNDGRRYFNTKVSDNYLVKGRFEYQGDSVLWRRYLHSHWNGITHCLRAGGRVDYDGPGNNTERNLRIRKYMLAMDNVARVKAREILGFFEKRPLKGKILDVGSGSGAIAAAFLERFPLTRAVLLDLPEVLACVRKPGRNRPSDERISYCPANILESWPVRKRSFDLVVLSNILHAYSEKELPHILTSASNCLKKEGLLLIHDFFFEHSPEKAALSDLNMFINTFNGRVFPGTAVMKELNRLGLCCTDLIPLKTDSAVIFASKDKANFDSLCLDPATSLIARILGSGFRKIYRIKTSDIHIPDWTDIRCRFGCDRHGSPHCPPNSPTPSKTKKILKDYSHALLLEGEPPTKTFQMRVLDAEREAFKAGFHKAFSYWAGPCSLCRSCNPEGPCRKSVNARPSMEGAGIDVFETARRAGATLKTLRRRGEYVKYFALLLLE